jgi:hypothetical protein
LFIYLIKKLLKIVSLLQKIQKFKVENNKLKIKILILKIFLKIRKFLFHQTDNLFYKKLN